MHCELSTPESLHDLQPGTAARRPLFGSLLLSTVGHLFLLLGLPVFFTLSFTPGTKSVHTLSATLVPVVRPEPLLDTLPDPGTETTTQDQVRDRIDTEPVFEEKTADAVTGSMPAPASGEKPPLEIETAAAELPEIQPATMAGSVHERPGEQGTPVDFSLAEIRVTAVTKLLNSVDSDVPPALPERLPMTPLQEKMLQKKLRTWSHKLDYMDLDEPTVEWTHKGQQYTATFNQVVAPDNTGIDQVFVEVSTEMNGTNMSTQINMKRLAFSNYAQFVDKWNPEVTLHNDELNGRFHSNSKLHLEYDRNTRPVFYGKVTTSSARVKKIRKKGRISSNEEIFRGGLETGVKRILLPKHFLPFPDDTAVDEAQVHNLKHDAKIVFHGDGTYDWKAVDRDVAVQTRVVPDGSYYIIAGKKVCLYLQGTIKGRILVYSPERITITDDLVYTGYPAFNPDDTNFLGLVSDKDIEIAPPEVTGPGDLLITASVYARRRFLVKRYHVEENAELFIYGSLTVGSLSATEPRYSTKIEFDPRLDNVRPPGFPVTDRYEVQAWNGAWALK